METFLHISSKLDLVPGDIFDNTSWLQSHYFENKYNYTRTNTLEMKLRSALEMRYSDRSRYSREDSELIIRELLPVNLELQLRAEFLKELVFERVRQARYPGLPSRVNCLFMSSSGLSIDEIFRTYGFDRNATNKAIYIFQSTNIANRFHAADPAHLECNAMDPSDIENCAQEYWAGRGTRVGAPLEILAIGRFTVVEKLDWPRP